MAVRIKTGSGNGFCIRQLITDAGRHYLRPWNNIYPMLEVGDEMEVVGRVTKWTMTF